MIHIIVGGFMGIGTLALFVGLIEINNDKTDCYGLYKKLSEHGKVLIAEMQNTIMSFLKLMFCFFMGIAAFCIGFDEFESNLKYILIAIIIYLVAGFACAVVNGYVSRVLLFTEVGVLICGVSNDLIEYNVLRHLIITRSKNPDLEQWNRIHISFVYDGCQYVSQLAVFDSDDDCADEEDLSIVQTEADNKLIYEWTKHIRRQT